MQRNETSSCAGSAARTTRRGWGTVGYCTACSTVRKGRCLLANLRAVGRWRELAAEVVRVREELLRHAGELFGDLPLYLHPTVVSPRKPGPSMVGARQCHARAHTCVRGARAFRVCARARAGPGRSA